MFETIFNFCKPSISWYRYFSSSLCMCSKAFIFYLSSIFLVRFNKKLIGTRTPFNFILFVMLGSISAITIIGGEYLFLPIVTVIIFLLLLNKLIMVIISTFPKVELFLKGPPVLLVKDGEILWDNLKKTRITNDEILNALQRQMHTNDFSKISSAYLASNGEINFIIDRSI